MLELNRIRNLFMDPSNDDISGLVQRINTVHAEVKGRTDLEKATLPMGLGNYQEWIDGLTMPVLMASEDELLREMASLFEGAVRWHDPRTMYTVTPPPLLGSVASAAVSSLYNPNIAWDIAAGKIALAERIVAALISDQVGWDLKESTGAFIFGGKGTDMTAIKVGLRNCLPASSKYGVGRNAVVISTKACHPCHVQACDWLGLGEDNCLRVETCTDGTVDLDDLNAVLRAAINRGLRVAAILVSGGTTMDHIFDPLNEIDKIRAGVVKELGLDYVPHLHADAVVGWPWVFFRDYDFEANPLKLTGAVLERVRFVAARAAHLGLADSFGVDFHKTGYCPYTSSMFLVRDRSRFENGADAACEYGSWMPFRYTLENSRPGQAALAAYFALHALGKHGFQTLLAHLSSMAVDLAEKIKQCGRFEVVNETSVGFAVVFAPTYSEGDPVTNVETRTAYSRGIIRELRSRGNPFFLDFLPAYSTGSNSVPFGCLKAYLMSPFSSRQINAELVSLLVDVDRKVRAARITAEHPEDTHDDHPLRECRSDAVSSH